jgi:predicted Zn finger-like uncharacterized protein
MPIRIVCPSCSAALSVKDEFAGRAVKCPKCGGVIPPSQPAAPTPAAPAAAAPSPPPAAPAAPPPPEPQKSPFEGLDEPAKPAKSGPKITGKPVSRSSRDEDDDDRPRRRDRDRDDEDDRPRKRRDDERDEDRPRKRDRDRDEGDRNRERDRERGGRDEERKGGSKERAAAMATGDAERGERARDKDGDRERERGERGERDDRGRNDGDRDRPGKRRRRDDDEDGPPRGKKQGGGGAGTVLAILGGLFLVCCGGGGGLAYYLYTKARDKAQEIVKAIEESNWKVTQFGYDQLKVGTTTRTKADESLGKGRIATADDLPKVFANDPGRTDAWVAKVNAKRAVVWQNGEDYIIAAFHPNSEGESRLQAKEWRPKSGASLKAGELDDAKFVQQHPTISPTTELRAEDLSKERKDDSFVTDEKYKDKTFVVTGKFINIYAYEGEPKVVLEGKPPSAPGKSDGGEITCKLAPGQTPFAYSRGQRLKISGKYSGGLGADVTFENCTIKGGEADPSVTVTADKLIADYGNKATADATYKDKELTITAARIESIEGGFATATPAGKKNSPRKIYVSFDTNLKNKFTNFRVGSTLKIKGKCTGIRDDEIQLDGAWFAP